MTCECSHVCVQVCVCSRQVAGECSHVCVQVCVCGRQVTCGVQVCMWPTSDVWMSTCLCTSVFVEDG